MGVRTLIDLTLQVGFDNSLDDLDFDRSLQETLDTMEDAAGGTGQLPATTYDRELSLGDITQGRLLYIEADGPLEVYINGAAATSAQVDASGGSYPTGFVGGETLTFDLDGTAIAVAFDAADTSLTNVINRINAAVALAGIATPVASNNAGELRLTSPTTGSASTIENIAGTSLATLGLAGAADAEGADPVPNTAAWSLRQMADPDGSQIDELKSYMLASVVVTSLYISNASDAAVNYRYVVVGDLSDPPAC